MTRSLEYYGFKVINEERSVKALIENLNLNKIKYQIVHVLPIESEQGLILFESPMSYHVGVYDKGTYHDVIDYQYTLTFKAFIQFI